MILDSLRNWAFYCGADSRLKRALEYLAAADLNTLEPGRYEIEGAEIFMKVTEGELKREEEASLEVHDKYIDVQVLIAGEVETMGWRERRECRVPRGPFDAGYYTNGVRYAFAFRCGRRHSVFCRPAAAFRRDQAWTVRRFRSRGRPCSDDRSGTDQKGGRKGDEIGACAACRRTRKEIETKQGRCQ